MSKAQRGFIAFVVVGAAVALLVVLAGGGSSERSRTTSTAPAPRTAGDYRRGALGAAVRFKRATAAAAKRVRAARSVAGKLAALDALEAVIVRAADDFSGLTP